MKREALQAEIDSRLVEATKDMVGSEPFDVDELKNRILAEMSRIMEGQAPTPGCTAIIDGDRITIRMPVTPQVLAGMASQYYANGETHEEVTRLLDEATEGRFREVLAEYVSKDGRRLWTLKPERIMLEIKIDEARGGAREE